MNPGLYSVILKTVTILKRYFIPEALFMIFLLAAGNPNDIPGQKKLSPCIKKSVFDPVRKVSIHSVDKYTNSVSTLSIPGSDHNLSFIGMTE